MREKAVGPLCSVTHAFPISSLCKGGPGGTRPSPTGTYWLAPAEMGLYCPWMSASFSFSVEYFGVSFALSLKGADIDRVQKCQKV